MIYATRNQGQEYDTQYIVGSIYSVASFLTRAPLPPYNAELHDYHWNSRTYFNLNIWDVDSFDLRVARDGAGLRTNTPGKRVQWKYTGGKMDFSYSGGKLHYSRKGKADYGFNQ